MLIAATLMSSLALGPQERPASNVLFTDVRVFNGREMLSGRRNVLVTGNKIAQVSDRAIVAPDGTVTIAGNGRTLMPGLIDAHVHLMFSSLSQVAMLTSDLSFITLAASREAERTLMRGYTSVRDLGGPVLSLKRGIDMGLATGPRIYPSGAFISQTGGHGDFRLPTDFPASPGQLSYGEKVGATIIADDADTVRKRARELLALGASQIKMMAGGGVSSVYDPLDVTQYTVEELRAGVEAAENWGTYVTVHAYTPKAIRQAIEAGVKCIDHGQLIDELTARLMKEKNVWWSLQPFVDDGNSAFEEGSPNRIKQREVQSGTDRAFGFAKKYGIKVAWGTDILFSAQAASLQTQRLTRMSTWFTPIEVLRMATSQNAELLALSGPRNPYPGKLGVVESGAYADLLLVDGDPTQNLNVLMDAANNLRVIMKDGKIVKRLAD